MAHWRPAHLQASVFGFLITPVAPLSQSRLGGVNPQFRIIINDPGKPLKLAWQVPYRTGPEKQEESRRVLQE
ncbi:hypothetical protein NDU88_004337 [Pleurodeles waltl]|uniref:Uncharacterized protein n=1 Tax=Pleurodeles waltl TaxID=8319 RepID=A0AAV7VJN7_PLEWA|nr:hypothetical protein NDU88_004337 [Pleurodeles waltl]